MHEFDIAYFAHQHIGDVLPSGENIGSPVILSVYRNNNQYTFYLCPRTDKGVAYLNSQIDTTSLTFFREEEPDKELPVPKVSKVGDRIFVESTTIRQPENTAEAVKEILETVRLAFGVRFDPADIQATIAAVETKGTEPPPASRNF